MKKITGALVASAGLLMFAAGAYILPFGMDIIVWALMQWTGDYWLAQAWLYAISFGLMALGYVLWRLAGEEEKRTSTKGAKKK